MFTISIDGKHCNYAMFIFKRMVNLAMERTAVAETKRNKKGLHLFGASLLLCKSIYFYPS